MSPEIKEKRRGRPKRVGPKSPPTKLKKNVTIDGDTLACLQAAQERMTTELGFRPNLTQTIQRLIAEYARQEKILRQAGIVE